MHCHATNIYRAPCCIQIDVNNIYRFMIMALSEYLFVIIMHHRIIYWYVHMMMVRAF